MNEILSIEEQTVQVARSFGLEREGVRAENIDWTRYITRGVLIELHIGRDRGRTKLALRDLGLQTDDPETQAAWTRLINPGSRNILPKWAIDRLETLESKARGNLERNSLKTPWKQGRFVPRRAFDSWKDENDRLRAEYLAQAQSIADQWSRVQTEMASEYAALGRASYDRLAASGVRTLGDRSVWVRNFVQRCLVQLGSGAGFLNSVRYDQDISFVPIGFRDPRLDEAGDDAMGAAVRESAERKAASDLQEFVVAIKADLAGGVYETVVDVLESIKRGGDTLPRNSTRGLKNLVERVEKLNLFDDEGLATKIREVAALVEIPSGERPIEAVKSALQALGSEARLALLEINQPPTRSGRSVGIEDVPGEITRPRARDRKAPVVDAAVSIGPARARRARAGVL